MSREIIQLNQREDSSIASPVSKISARAFIVGCPRSGTTLLQSMLGAHSRVATFPESHFFAYLSPRPWWREVPITPNPIRVGERLARFLDEAGHPELAVDIPRKVRSKRVWARVFTGLMDRMAVDQECDNWIEKTPSHLAFMRQIRRHISGASFIHILRDGSATVASLYDVTRRHPQAWGGEWSLEKCARVWNRSFERHVAVAGQDNHIMIRYEILAEDPACQLRRACRFLNINYESSMLKGDEYDRVATPDEPWKSGVAGGVGGVAVNKFNAVFDSAQRAWAMRRLHDASRLNEWAAQP